MVMPRVGSLVRLLEGGGRDVGSVPGLVYASKLRGDGERVYWVMWFTPDGVYRQGVRNVGCLEVLVW